MSWYLISIAYMMIFAAGIITCRGVTMIRGLRTHARTLPKATMEAFLERVQENNDIGELKLNELVPFVVDGMTLGYTSIDFAEECKLYKDTFVDVDGSLGLAPSLEGSKDVTIRTHAVGKVTRAMKDKGLIKGWRDELLPVVASFSSPPVLLMERAAYPFFGMKGYGVHVNGFTIINHSSTQSELKLWVAKRSATKQTWPSMLDHLVAGGQPHGISPSDNVVKECGEEAGIPEQLARTAVPVSAVSYSGLDEERRLKRNCLFCYDLELPADFQPIPCDGEVQSFELQSLDWVIEKIALGGKGGYKPNCHLVVLDFLIRKGAISPESPLYLDLIASLRGTECH